MINIAINGFGRIGRQAFKVALSRRNMRVVAINDLGDSNTLAHLLKYDTVYGVYPAEVLAEKNSLRVAGHKVAVFNEREPGKLPWKKLKVDVVLECTGVFRTKELCQPHLEAGAKKVIISAPAKGEGVPTCVLGVNAGKISGADKIHKKEKIINNASCTTNCIAPVMAVLEETFGVQKAAMTTVHGYTAEQNLQDGPHKDLRRARAAAVNIVPTTTGAATATTLTIPALKGKFDGLAIRVPVPVVSLSDVTALLKKNVTVSEVNQAFQAAAKTRRFKGILAVTKEPLVSADFIGSTYSAIVDLSLTNVVAGNLVKVIAWYDNEVGYANRLIEAAEQLG